MKYTAVLGFLSIGLAPVLGSAQQVQSPNPVLAGYSTALEELARSVSGPVVQIAVKRIAPVEKEDP
jgi:hypothetical protein